jgi:hypothetical protein
MMQFDRDHHALAVNHGQAMFRERRTQLPRNQVARPVSITFAILPVPV